MSIYVQESDLKGQSKTAKDIFTVSDVQEYLDKFEIIYLQDLLGCELYEEFANDFAILGNAPTDPKFIAIWNMFCKDDSCGIMRSEGITKMLSLFVYFEYLRDQPAKNNIGGMQLNEQANSTASTYSQTNIFTNYNEAIDSYCAIQWYICDNPNNYDYSKYNGQYKAIIGYI